jgi:hypothetical protein
MSKGVVDVNERLLTGCQQYLGLLTKAFDSDGSSIKPPRKEGK